MVDLTGTGLGPDHWPSLALDTMLSSAYFLAGFHLIRQEKMQSRRTAWILSFLCSVACAICSLEYLFQIYQKKFDTASILYKDDRLSRFLTVFFIVYLLLDLVVGMKYYPKEIDPLSGWCHHTAYILLNLWALRDEFTVAGCAAMVIEIPTAILGIGKIWPSMRADKMFGFSFFTTRILYYGLLIHSMYINERNGTAKVRIFPIGVPLLLLHLHWFYGWVKQQRRLAARGDQKLHTP